MKEPQSQIGNTTQFQYITLLQRNVTNRPSRTRLPVEMRIGLRRRKFVISGPRGDR
jgi:hypothetical protein